MSNYCKNCYELTEELENHKRWIKDYKQKLEDAEEFANAKITQCGNLIKQLNETFEQLEAYKMEAEEGKEINAELKAENEELKKRVDDLLHKPEIQDKILWKIDNEALLGGKDAYIYKLKQTLTEIKEIAEANKKYIYVSPSYFVAGDSLEFSFEFTKDILQKISEVEDE